MFVKLKKKLWKYVVNCETKNGPVIKNLSRKNNNKRWKNWSQNKNKKNGGKISKFEWKNGFEIKKNVEKK